MAGRRWCSASSVCLALSVSLVAALSAQDLVALHIKVTLLDAAKTPVPIARAALLISDEPPTSAPRRVLTSADGTATVRLRPGLYLVESDDPVAFGGKGYEWRQEIRVTAGRDFTLEFTAANAEVGAAPPPPSSSGAASASSAAAEAASLPPQARDSVVAIWTPESRASGFIFNTSGLVATNQRVVGNARTVDVQLASSLKVAARVLIADPSRDVAVLWIDAAAAAAMHPAALSCPPKTPAPTEGQKLIALGAPLRGEKEAEPGEVFHVEAHSVAADFRLADGSLGGPVFGSGGVLAGLTSVLEDAKKDSAQSYRVARDVRVVPLDDVCAAAGVAEKAMASTEAPSATHLPVEPEKPIDLKVLDDVVRKRQGTLNPYQVSSASFDISFLTPVTIHGASQRSSSRGFQSATQLIATDFGVWSDYFGDTPPVLVVRVTPKMAEGFWTSVGRAAAYTQGIAIPSIKHFKPGFLRMRAYCGDDEVTPIHPFTLVQRVSDTDAVREGLYVFDPQTFAHCASVKLVMFSEKEPEKPDTRIIDPKILERIQADFADLRP